ncbi:MAG: large-conductance mechanosensitive channel protein MscL [Muribaculaceae bacterium]
MSKFLTEFKEFAMRGNVMDMAVGVIIGGAFGKIVTSLVNDVIMPLVGLVVGGIDFTNLKWVFAEATETTPEAALMYGQFIQNVVDFLIIAFCIFLMIKGISKLTKKKEEAPAEPAPAPEPSAEEKLLTEIRDLLKDKK